MSLQDWDFYFCPVDDHPATVFVDLGLVEYAPEPRRPVCTRVSVNLQISTEEGLPDESESETLNSIEDDLFEELCRLRRARYVGRITSQSRREFFYYSATGDGLEAAALQVIGKHPVYTPVVQQSQDPEWSAYLDLLYPSELDLQSIATRRQLEELQQLGEDLTSPREIAHDIGFPSRQTREQFVKAVDGEGFTLSELDEGESGNPDLPYGVRLVRRDRLDLTMLDGLVSDLLIRAQDAGGEYIGWEIGGE